MSRKALPFIFINLGGEMMYILDQRLKAQNIPLEKGKKVIHDIIGTMFNRKFMEELFRPQELYGKRAIRTLFDRLAHASNMRLNSASMDKLYDLMTMALKYQILMVPRPRDIFLVTMNHMDGMRDMTSDAPHISAHVENVYRLLLENYRDISDGEYFLLRQTILNFFQDFHVRVSLFLKEKKQLNNGTFVIPTSGEKLPWGMPIPLGTINFYAPPKEPGGPVTKRASKQFKVLASYVTPAQPGSFEMTGNRVTTLGTNMYLRAALEAGSKSSDATAAAPATDGAQPAFSANATPLQANVPSDIEQHVADPNAKAQLDMLCQLLGGGGTAAPDEKSRVKINLFASDAEEEAAAEAKFKQIVSASGGKVVNIDAAKGNYNEQLNKIMQELSVKETGGGGDDDDILALMDSAGT